MYCNEKVYIFRLTSLLTCVSGDSSYWLIVNILPPAGVETLVDSCSISVSTIVD